MTVINWFKTNTMIVNPDKFQSMIISSKKDLSKSVKLLGIEIDNTLNFEKHISNICKKASNELNAICRLQTFIGHKEKAIINTFVHSNFNYGCLIWHFSSKKSQKREKYYGWSLKSLLNGCLRSYAEILEKSSSISMETKRLCRMVYEIFKTLKNLDPVFMKDKVHYPPNGTNKK